MRVLVIGDGFISGPYGALQAVHRKVDLRQLGSGLIFFVTIEGDTLHRVLTLLLNEMA